jgi:cholesterol transport system auxiliary component
MPYAQARWSMPPAQLVTQRVRAVLSQQRPVVAPGDGPIEHVLQLSLEAFGQSFDTPQSSQGTVQLRATLLKGDALVAQREFVARAPAPTADAAGGVRALSLATQTVANELAGWVATNIR